MKKTLAKVVSPIFALSPTYLLVLLFLVDGLLVFFFHARILDGLSQVWIFVSFLASSVGNFFAAMWSTLVGAFSWLI